MLPIWILDRWRLILEIAAAVILLIWIGALTIQTKSLKADLRECQVFKKETEALGRLAEEKAKQKEADDAARIKRAFDDRNLALKRLSDERTRRSQLPSAPIVAEGTGNLCKLTPADFERAYSQLARDLSGIAQEGDDSIVDGHALLKAR